MNNHCAVAVVGGRVVGYEWFCDKPLHLEERYAYKVEIPSEAIYAYDACILPEHRISGIWVKFKLVYLRELMERLHKRKIITMIDRGNHMSLNTHLRFGFQVVRTVFVLKLFRRSFFLGRNARGNGPSFPFRTSVPGEHEESWPSKSAPTEQVTIS